MPTFSTMAARVTTEALPLRELERGAIAFAVRPRVEGLPGVQRFFVFLGAEDRAVWRRVVVGKKRLAAPGSGEREWAYVDRVASSRAALEVDLGPETYMTKTRGLRHQPGVRPLADGRYRILEHGTHVHLAYALDERDALDPERMAMLEGLGVHARGSVVVAVFNPLAKWSRRATVAYGGDPDDPAPFREPSIFPEEAQARFGDKRFAPLAPDLLDVEGAELVLMGAQDEVPGDDERPGAPSGKT